MDVCYLRATWEMCYATWMLLGCDFGLFVNVSEKMLVLFILDGYILLGCYLDATWERCYATWMLPGCYLDATWAFS